MKTEVEIRVMLLDTKEWAIASRPPEAGRGGKDPPLEPRGSREPCPPLDFGFLTSRP